MKREIMTKPGRALLAAFAATIAAIPQAQADAVADF